MQPIDHLAWMRIALAVAIHVIVFLIACWDLFALASARPDLTVSRIVQDWAVMNPILPIAVGIAMGHLFWPVK